ncbi:carbohydrate kinase family protein [Agromyces seonyuensis]|uniref:Carbohydrate kinase family protein n=1 Tax=Agromyces seonyuensis TaxID=2662446 RepID=A0A6I4NRY3_9MICO|nr:carbohydrate kinase family protein [Agromyces seonyuensis]MWB97186.1 carbohydrate kinase family protein [Agromyces seonyuensis]
MDAPEVLIAGPATWNRMIELDRLPEPRPHMQFATGWFDAVGGTSAGKALGLTALGRRVALHALLGDDEPGRRVAAALEGARVPLLAAGADVTEQHCNLMTPAGERVSLFLATPTPVAAEPPAGVLEALEAARVAVLDLSGLGASLLPAAAERGIPVWTDLHDYDGENPFHEPFIAAADVAFCNADGVGGRPDALLDSLVARGIRIAVCTLGAEGAVAVTADEPGVRHRVAAVPVDVVDTNGAGDAFVAGFLDAHLAGAALEDCLAAASADAALALTTRNLHPVLDRAP